ncbi:hypothetical protein VIVU109784_02980 [Vibrio vulnificus]|uniref:Uncharacterized protein n=1 Tax=Vibrio vulnificus (strain CMCP6) TaxID=216895 RepID=A0A3Q0L1D6_VIBVU|nr:hypothetical protein [Vibrio vulnificus]AAO08623.1 hypothetical protein VV1_0084 [Vibrio vulnificus CMCP6]QBN13465.1 hypothetical protein E2I22_04200 [Vibrio vulnificus]HAS8364494.1 hypothetical protein [Vibrio vulnificus]HDY8045461.1 hypothetical protein [Vibrio vulnificus]HDY8222592.1 hypothetical protein [Vibrio vulnificus]
MSEKLHAIGFKVFKPYLGEVDTEIGKLAVFNYVVRANLDLMKSFKGDIEGLSGEEYLRLLARFTCYPIDTLSEDKQRPDSYVLDEELCAKLSRSSLENIASLILKKGEEKTSGNEMNAIEALHKRHVKQHKDTVSRAKTYAESVFSNQIGKQYQDLNILGKSLEEQLKTIKSSTYLVDDTIKNIMQSSPEQEWMHRLATQGSVARDTWSDYVKSIIPNSPTSDIQSFLSQDNPALSAVKNIEYFASLPPHLKAIHDIMPANLKSINDAVLAANQVGKAEHIKPIISSESHLELPTLSDLAYTVGPTAVDRTNERLDTLIDVSIENNSYIQEQTNVQRETAEETKKSSDAAKKFSWWTFIISFIAAVATVIGVALTVYSLYQDKELEIQRASYEELLQRKNNELEKINLELDKLKAKSSSLEQTPELEAKAPVSTPSP